MTSPKQRYTIHKFWYILLFGIFCVFAVILVMFSRELGMEGMKELLRQYGYYGILLWAFLEGETIVIIAGVFSGKLGLNPWWIALCAFMGSFLSDQLMFSLGRFRGEKALVYFPKLAVHVERAGKIAGKYDTFLILGFRFVYGIRNVTPILLGLGEVSYQKFFVLNLISALVWAFTFTFGGVYIGKAFLGIIRHVGLGAFLLILFCLVFCAVWFLLRRFRSGRQAVRNRKASGEREEDADK